MHVGAEASYVGFDSLLFKLAQGAWQLEQVECLVECDGFDALAFVEVGKAWFLVVAGCANLHYGAKTSDLYAHGFTRLRVGTEFAFAHTVLSLFVECAFNLRVKILVEVADHLCPVLLSFSHLVELFLNVGGEVVVHDFGEVFHQEVIDYEPCVGGHKFAAVAAHIFGERLFGYVVAGQCELAVVAWLSLVVALDHIFAVLNGRYGGGVG